MNQHAVVVLRHLAKGPDHDTHGSDTTGLWLNNYAPARTRLKNDGLVRFTGKRTTNRRGHTCKVWELTDAGRAEAEGLTLA